MLSLFSKSPEHRCNKIAIFCDIGMPYESAILCYKVKEKFKFKSTLMYVFSNSPADFKKTLVPKNEIILIESLQHLVTELSKFLIEKSSNPSKLEIYLSILLNTQISTEIDICRDVFIKIENPNVSLFCYVDKAKCNKQISSPTPNENKTDIKNELKFQFDLSTLNVSIQNIVEPKYSVVCINGKAKYMFNYLSNYDSKERNYELCVPDFVKYTLKHTKPSSLFISSSQIAPLRQIKLKMYEKDLPESKQNVIEDRKSIINEKDYEQLYQEYRDKQDKNRSVNPVSTSTRFGLAGASLTLSITKKTLEIERKKNMVSAIPSLTKQSVQEETDPDKPIVANSLNATTKITTKSFVGDDNSGNLDRKKTPMNNIINLGKNEKKISKKQNNKRKKKKNKQKTSSDTKSSKKETSLESNMHLSQESFETDSKNKNIELSDVPQIETDDIMSQTLSEDIKNEHIDDLKSIFSALSEKDRSRTASPVYPDDQEFEEDINMDDYVFIEKENIDDSFTPKNKKINKNITNLSDELKRSDEERLDNDGKISINIREEENTDMDKKDLPKSFSRLFDPKTDDTKPKPKEKPNGVKIQKNFSEMAERLLLKDPMTGKPLDLRTFGKSRSSSVSHNSQQLRTPLTNKPDDVIVDEATGVIKKKKVIKPPSVDIQRVIYLDGKRQIQNIRVINLPDEEQHEVKKTKSVSNRDLKPKMPNGISKSARTILKSSSVASQATNKKYHTLVRRKH